MVVYGDCHAIVRSIDLAWGGSVPLFVVVSVNIVVRCACVFGFLCLEVWDFRGRFQGFVSLPCVPRMVGLRLWHPGEMWAEWLWQVSFSFARLCVQWGGTAGEGL